MLRPGAIVAAKPPTILKLRSWSRRDDYRVRTAAFADAQAAGTIDPDLVHVMLLSLAAYWAALPQVARMIAAAAPDEDARRRAREVEAARRLICPSTRPKART